MRESEHKNNIYCDVVNCAYNDDLCHCTAPTVEVGTAAANSCTASCSGETQCATFRPKTPYKSGYQAV
ncbi:DUF1540 domain-containing protein [Oscillospiraceae bacterium LTW-04]|nr:DUF1540 domain-containing protein [Oscillospiraceae bacterium MB24-C1]